MHTLYDMIQYDACTPPSVTQVSFAFPTHPDPCIADDPAKKHRQSAAEKCRKQQFHAHHGPMPERSTCECFYERIRHAKLTRLLAFSLSAARVVGSGPWQCNRSTDEYETGTMIYAARGMRQGEAGWELNLSTHHSRSFASTTR